MSLIFGDAAEAVALLDNIHESEIPVLGKASPGSQFSFFTIGLSDTNLMGASTFIRFRKMMNTVMKQ